MSSFSMITGADSNVYVYTVEASGACELDFVHDGHMINREDQSDCPLVTHHSWFPGQQEVIVSLATDGSLHAWKHRHKL